MKTKTEFVIATTVVDYNSYRDDYEGFCVDMGCEPSEERFQLWCENETRMNWEDDIMNIRDHEAYNVPVKISGTLGLWWGHPEIKPVNEKSVYDAILRCIAACDDAVVKFNDGKIEVEAMHHDGKNCFTISRADGKRFEYLYA